MWPLRIGTGMAPEQAFQARKRPNGPQSAAGGKEKEGKVQEMTGIAVSLNQSAATNQPVAGTRVMIVEDEAVVALHLRQELTALGYVVAGVATNAEQALKMVDDALPDIVLMDIHIQGEMDGIETARKIARYLHIRRTPR